MRSKNFSKIACDSVGREGVGAPPPNPWPGSTTIFKNGLLRCRERGEIVHMAYFLETHPWRQIKEKMPGGDVLRTPQV